MAWTDEPISEPQIKFIQDLVEAKDISSLPQAQIDFIRPLKQDSNEVDTDKQIANLIRMNKGQASEAIDLLKQLPKKPLPSTPVQAVETGGVALPTQATQATQVAQNPQSTTREGYFFIVDPTNGEERFFKVKHGKEGTRWEGYVFLEVQASDYWYPIKDSKHREAVLAEINKDPVFAMNEYGVRIGSCGVCGRTLTDRDSRLRGIGPICAARLDMEAAAPTKDQLELLRRLGLHD